MYKLGTRWIGYVPTFLSYRISQLIADLSYLLYRSAVKKSSANLKLAFPSLSLREISGLTSKMFRNYGKYLVDYGRFTSRDSQSVLEAIGFFDGEEKLQSAVQMHKGLILVTAHLGNWELGGIFLSRYGVKTNVVTLQDDDMEIDNARRWYRELHNVTTITIGDSPFSTLEIAKALRNNESVAMLIDRCDHRLETLTASFFHKPTPFPRGPFVLSRITGAPIVVGFVVRDQKGYKGIIEGPFLVTSQEHEQTVLEEVVKIMEKHITIYPDQWYNFTLV